MSMSAMYHDQSTLFESPRKKTFTIMAKPICNLLLSIRSSQLHYHTCDIEDDDEYIHTDVVMMMIYI